MGPLMLKRLALILGAIIYATIAHAAGTVPGFSLTPQFDLTGAAMPGCKLYVIQAGTVSTPQNAYQDTGLTNLLPNPMTCDASARLSQFFVADGLIKLRLTTSSGTQVFVGDNLLVVGPSSGGGGGGVIDPTTIAATGDVKASYSANPISGWVRMNGRTIGSATSGATERANSDTQALFQYLWSTDANLAVSGGRGASSLADWSANKTIALPDSRGRALAGLDDMGNSAAGRLTATYFGATGGCSGALGTTLGVACGGESQTLTLAQAPTGIVSSGTITVSGPGTNGGVPIAPAGGSVGNTQVQPSGSSGAFAPTTPITGWGPSQTMQGTGQTMTSTNTGGSAHPQIQPTMLITVYIKL